MNDLIVNKEIVFIGPGHRLFNFSRLWIIRFRGRRDLIGKNGEEDELDGALISSCLSLDTKELAWQRLIDKLRDGSQICLQDGIDVQDVELNWSFHGRVPRTWTVDFDQGVIFFDRTGSYAGQNHFHHMTIPESTPFNVYQLQTYKPKLKVDDFNPQNCEPWIPENIVPNSMFEFVFRLVSDYYHDFHMSGCSIEYIQDFQSLAYGILSCFTINFEVDSRPVSKSAPEIDLLGTWHHTSYGRRWKKYCIPPIVPTVELGHVTVIFAQDMDHARGLCQLHFEEDQGDIPEDPGLNQEKTYIVTSLTSVQLFKVSTRAWKETKVYGLLHPFDDPDPIGVSMFLNAIQSPYYPLTTRLHKIPVELQELILDFVSPLEVGRAYYGAILDIGLPFRWTTSQKIPLKLLSRGRRLQNIHDQYPLQPVVFFNEYLGLVYQQDQHGTAKCKLNRENCCMAPVEVISSLFV